MFLRVHTASTISGTLFVLHQRILSIIILLRLMRPSAKTRCIFFFCLILTLFLQSYAILFHFKDGIQGPDICPSYAGSEL
jgi:hypothetical protein